MPNLFTPAQAERLKREAKKLHKTLPSLSLGQVQDLVAVKNGYRNWSLLSKHSLPHADILRTFDLKEAPYAGGSPGIYFIHIKVTDRKLRSRLANERPQFDLPNQTGWIFRAATRPQHVLSPFIDASYKPRRAVFVNGEWKAILSTNGIADADIHAHIELTLQPILNELRMRAAMALEPWLRAPDGTGKFHLFYTCPQESGISEIAQKSYPTLEDAKNAELPNGSVKTRISSQYGFLSYQEPFGWQGPLDGGPSVETALPPIRQRPKSEWFDRGFNYQILDVPAGTGGNRIYEVSHLTVSDDVTKPDDAKLIYDEIDQVSRMGGSDSTVWLDVQGGIIPQSVHTAVKHLIGFGVGLVVTIKGKSSLSSPESFPDDFMQDLCATYRGGVFWCPITQQIMHPERGMSDPGW